MLKKAILMIYLVIFTTVNNMENLWTQTYEKTINGYWGEVESISGPGSSLEQTAIIRNEISLLIKYLEISSILDVPCGDYHWMRLVNLYNCSYIGIDIVKPLIERNNTFYGDTKHTFLYLDATEDCLPHCDLIICRDLLVHLSTNDVYKVLKNFKQSGAKYLLTTTFSKRSGKNIDIETGGWRPINLEAEPFNFPIPESIINEHCTEQSGTYNDKSLGLWKLKDIVIYD